MKRNLIMFFLFIFVFDVSGQQKNASDNVIITSEKTTTRVYTENGELHANVSPDDVTKFKATGYVRYKDFGAKGDGKTDDLEVIAATHAFANSYGLPVKADDGATYYIGGKDRTAVIRTETDFGKATFILDDTAVQNRNASVFMVSSTLQPFKLEAVMTLQKNQRQINASLPAPCLVTVTNAAVKQYIRFGLNQNNGSSQADILIQPEPDVL